MKAKYKKCLGHIERYWDKATFKSTKDGRQRLGLPKAYVSPNDSRFGRDQFYWDSYFIILGLVEAGRIDLAKGMIDNFVFLFDKLGFVPVRNTFSNLTISQPPFLTSMALEVFRYDQDKKWLARVAKAAERELKDYWQDKFGTDEQWPKHLLPNGLSRYAGSYRTSFLAEYESGWDETSRFQDRCLDFAPIDLNSLLYKYERDLATMHDILNDTKRKNAFLKAAERRKSLVNEHCWNKRKGFFFDYDHKKGKVSRFYSLAGFYPLWAGLASKEQSEAMMKNLKRFEYRHGLSNTQRRGLKKPRRQWDHPNGWPNQQWIVIKGLLNYGHYCEAGRLTEKWLDLNLKVFEETGKMWEKYDVVKGAVGHGDYRYETQAGFGWTNAVFLRLCKEFDLE